ncbi:MAG: HEAT repeat domain-containing protein [bacterium]|nr:HEAT repeat domain-containing protein [bacterium]
MSVSRVLLTILITLLLTVVCFADSTNTSSELFDGPPHFSNGKALSPGWENRIDYSAESDLRLFWVASSGEPKWEAIRKRADSTLVSRGKSAVPFLISRLSTDDARDRQTVNQLLKKIGTPAVESLLMVIDTAKSRDEATLAIQTLGDIGDSTALPRLLQAASDTAFRIRTSAALALMSYPKLPLSVIEKMRNLAQDKLPGIRRNALRGLVLQSDIPSIPYIVGGLSDSMFSIRETLMYTLSGKPSKKDSSDMAKLAAREQFRSALRDFLDKKLLPALERQNYLEFHTEQGVISNTRTARAATLPVADNRALLMYLRAYRTLDGGKTTIWSRAALHTDPAIRAEAVRAGTKKQTNGKVTLARYAKKLRDDPDPIVKAAY